MGKNLGMGAFKPRYLCSENGRGLSDMDLAVSVRRPKSTKGPMDP